MSAGKFIGRVGGLAFALGVGVAAYSGTAVASADSPSSGSPSHSGASHSDSAGTRPAASRGAGKAAPPNRARVSAAPLPAATPTVTAPRPINTDTPTLPTESVVELTALAQSRRESAVATTAAPAAALSAAAEEPETPEVAVTLVQDPAPQNIALIMGGSGTPIPSDTYITNAFTKYVVPNSPVGTIPEGLFTPEGLYPITGVKSLPLDTSVDQGNQILYDQILEQIAAGNTVTVFGYSQSAIMSSLVLGPGNTNCVNTSECSIPEGSPVNFVFVGNEMNPNGGFLSRFPDLDLPALGIPFYGATPEDSFAVSNYTLEYDGFADFPRYTFNALSVLNAGLGIAFVHGTYLQLTPEQIASAIELPTSCGTDPCTTEQHYYIIPTENLPLLQPLRLIPLIGNPLADLLQPALRVIVNLGYGDPKYGWSTDGYANQLTTFGVFPQVDWVETAQLFVAGVVQGIKDFIADISPGGSMSQELHKLFQPASSSDSDAPQSFPDSIISAVQNLVTNVGEAISGTAASLYSILLPTADIVNSLVVMLPTYMIDLFLGGIEQVLSGDIVDGLLNAVGLPLAAAVGLGITAALIEVLVVGGVLGDIVSNITSLFTA